MQKSSKSGRPQRKQAYDPIDLEVLWSRLLTVVDEAAYAVIRTSMSKVVVEGRDFGALLLDPAGRLLAADVSIASKTGTISIAVKEMLKYFPAHTLKPGDMLITNNPWWIMGHLNDIAVVAPLFYKKRLVGFAECMAHMADIGGCLSGPPRELYEEGLIIPAVKAVKAGVEDDTFFAMLGANVRVEGQVLGDVRALIAGCRVMEAKLGEFLAQHGMIGLDALGETIITQSREAMRKGIRAYIPDGEYQGHASVDGFEKPLEIHTRVKVRKGEVHVDFAGSSPQSTQGINCTLVYTAVWATYTIKCLANPHLPNNEGTFSPIRVTAPEGSFLNPKFPAPVRMKPSSGHYIPDAIIDALKGVMRERVLAESGNKFLLDFAGRDEHDRPYSDVMFVMGGMGARGTKDGLHCMSFPANSSNLPIEVLEATIPVRVLHKRIRTDSGGAGKYRGGCGQEFAFQSVSPRPITVRPVHGKLSAGPGGLRGGHAGAGGDLRVNGQSVPDKVPRVLHEGDVMELIVPGSGGLYAPAERDRDALLRDVRNGIVSPEAAERLYGLKETEPVTPAPQAEEVSR
jgi:N-methylhydantoinase B/oxoprolinase/acetone carboxylase alpha subunit